MNQIFNKLKQNWRKVIIPIFITTIVWSIFYERNEIYLYAWERPENFSFLEKGSKTKIVFYAGDVVLRDGKVVKNFRRNSLDIPDGINSFPLVRIDSFDLPENLTANTDEVVDFVASICGPYKKCQIDFEARTSEYKFYISLMNKVREFLPNKKISITALASWCSGDTFISNLSAEVAVPMFYRMGKDSDKIKSGDVDSWFLSNSKCNDSIALSTDEFDFEYSYYSKNKSIYLFNPEPWNKESYQKALIFLGK